MHRMTEPAGARSATGVGHGEGGAAGNAGEDAFLLRQRLRPLHALGPGDRRQLVIEMLVDRFLQHGRDEVRRPALDRVRLEGRVARRGRTVGHALLHLPAADQLGVGGLAEHDARLRTFPAQHAGDADHVPPVP